MFENHVWKVLEFIIKESDYVHQTSIWEILCKTEVWENFKLKLNHKKNL